MYKIIGADGREYGPVGADQVRQWVVEGRANSQTRVQAEGTNEWKSLSVFAELTPASAPAVAGVPPTMSPPVQTAVSSQPPGASKKIAAGICAILFGPLGIHKFILGYTGEGVTMLLISVLTCGIGAIPMRIISLIEGIIYLTKTDEEFVRTYILNKKGWF
jgi:TM2 domain-containing membrane protein YozV